MKKEYAECHHLYHEECLDDERFQLYFRLSRSHKEVVNGLLPASLLSAEQNTFYLNRMRSSYLRLPPVSYLLLPALLPAPGVPAAAGLPVALPLQQSCVSGAK
ncbi:hypothetical protein EYF80_009712 [Liparis tanakae]|uniref:Uncharacterized protein n=1 Tax=Liparis tanakae TaxID=230148 RepID=A0A4Z2IQE8_9TELE|nr:hypothetical protein EYF80_009712 [Liparis tanakae]